METKNYLTKQEQMIFEIIKDTPLAITTKQISEMFPNFTRQRINELLKSLKDKGRIISLKKGVYALTIAKTNLELYKNALSIYPGYISFLSALRYYNLIDYEPTTIFISTTNKSKTIYEGNFVFKYINLKNKYSDYLLKDGVFVSNLEKTIFDCFYKPQYCGSYCVLSKAIFDSAEIIDWNKLKQIYDKYATARQFQITGYILELLKTKTNCKIPKNILFYFNSKKKSKVKLINTNSKSIYISKWLLQDNLGEKEILSWW